jgi:hypothetical protein
VQDDNSTPPVEGPTLEPTPVTPEVPTPPNEVTNPVFAQPVATPVDATKKVKNVTWES